MVGAVPAAPFCGCPMGIKSTCRKPAAENDGTPAWAAVTKRFAIFGGPGALWNVTAETLEAQHAEIIVVLSGTDDRYAQRVHARHSYAASELLRDMRFADILFVGERGRRVVDYRRFHDVVDV